MSKVCAVIIGDSHYGAVAAYAESSLPAGLVGNSALAIYNAWKYNLNYEYCVVESGRWILNPALVNEFANLAGQFDAVKVFMMFGGGHHHALSLLRHPIPFDFYERSSKLVELDEGSTLLSRDAVRDVLDEKIQPSIRNMRAMREAFPDYECWHVQSPPPNRDNQFIRENMGAWFEQNFSEAERNAISSPRLRFKMWSLHSEIYKAYCHKLGIGFVPVPETTHDEEGFLLPEYYGSDATHASSSYGGIVIEKIEERLATKLDCWLPFG